MVLHLIGDIVVSVLAVVATAVSVGLWFNTNDVNNRRTICALAMAGCAMLVFEYAWFFTHDPTPRIGDGVLVQWERGPFTGLNLSCLVLAYAVYGSVDYATTAIFMVLAVLVGAFWTASMFCFRNDRYWFLAISAAYCFGLTILKFKGTRRNKDNMYNLVLLIGSLVGVAVGAASLFGPENIDGISENLQFAIFASGDLVLIPGLYIIMMITQGEEESIISKIKNRAADTIAGEAAKLKSKKGKKNAAGAAVDEDA